jgi:hypothetical protein
MSGVSDNENAGWRVSEVIDGLRRRLGGVTGQLGSPRAGATDGATAGRPGAQDESVDRIADEPGSIPLPNWRWE